MADVGGFERVTQTVFDELVAAEKLVPWTFYFTPTQFYLARTKNTYNTYGGASIQEIVNELLQRNSFITELIEIMAVHQTFRNMMVQAIISDNTFLTFVSEYLLSDEDFRTMILQEIAQLSIRETVINVVSELVSIVAPDGSNIATNEGGTLTLQMATNSQYGIVKGQENDTQAAIQNISATDGLLGLNWDLLKSLVENIMDVKDTAVVNQLDYMMDIKDTAIKNSINVRAEDDCIVGHNENNGSGMIVLPIRQLDEEPANPGAGTMYLVNEHADTP